MPDTNYQTDSLWSNIRTHILIPCLPYYYVLVALIAFWINPRLFIYALLIGLTILILVLSGCALFTRHLPHGLRAEDMHDRESIERGLRDEVARLIHFERCKSCRDTQKRVEAAKELAKVIWEKQKAGMNWDDLDDEECEECQCEACRARGGFYAYPEPQPQPQTRRTGGKKKRSGKRRM